MATNETLIKLRNENFKKSGDQGLTMRKVAEAAGMRLSNFKTISKLFQN
jgi:hypothetical protein